MVSAIKDRGCTSKGAFIYKIHVKSTNGKVYIWMCGLKFLVLVAPMVINQSINIYFENVLIDIDIVVLMLVSSHFQDSHRQACFRDCPLRY